MNILFLDAYYEPEITAYTHLENDLIEGLIMNNNIHIICPIPTRGISNDIREQYKKIKNEKKYDGRVTVERFWAPREKKNPLLRALRYFWCNMRSYQKAVKHDNIDIIFSNSTPPTQGLLCGLIAKKLSKKKKKKIPFIYNLQDIFPDSLKTSNLCSDESILWKIGRIVEKKTYDMADKILVISEGFKNNLRNKNVDLNKIEIIPNWIDTEKMCPIEKQNNRLFDEFNIDKDKYCVLYAGNFGEIQGADIILKAAEKLENQKNIQFIIFGAGPYFNDAKNKAKELSNVFIHELMPQNRVSEVYSMGDVAIISCKKGISNIGLPSKLNSIIACNTPIIACYDKESDVCSIIEKNNFGICINPEDEGELTESILSMYNRNFRITTGLDFIKKHHSKENSVKNYVEVINSF